jgi:hypothetical protein
MAVPGADSSDPARPPNTNWGVLARILGALSLTGGWWGLLAALAARWNPTPEIDGVLIAFLLALGMVIAPGVLVFTLSIAVVGFQLRRATWSRWAYLQGEGERYVKEQRSNWRAALRRRWRYAWLWVALGAVPLQLFMLVQCGGYHLGHQLLVGVGLLVPLLVIAAVSDLRVWRARMTPAEGAMVSDAGAYVRGELHLWPRGVKSVELLGGDFGVLRVTYAAGERTTAEVDVPVPQGRGDEARALAEQIREKWGPR